MFACFVDFRKAYYSVWREGLFFKLINYGCSRKVVTILLMNMYSSVKSAVKLEQGVTPFFQSHIGVKQRLKATVYRHLNQLNSCKV